MKMDIRQMELYVRIQELLKVVGMPYLEILRDVMTNQLRNLENDIVSYKVNVSVMDKKSRLSNLLNEKFLYKTQSESSFVFQKRMILSDKSFDTIEEELSRKNAFLIIVIYDEMDFQKTLEFMERMMESRSYPFVLILNDVDGTMCFSSVENAIFRWLEEHREKISENHLIECIEYSSMKAIQGQEQLDQHLLCESNFLNVKQKILCFIDLLNRKHLIPGYVSYYRYLLNLCWNELDGKINSYEEELCKLLDIKERIESVKVEFGDTVKRKWLDECHVVIDRISFEQRPENMIIVKKIVTDTVNCRIRGFFESRIKPIITENLKYIQNAYQGFLGTIIQELYWMSTEEKEKLKEKSSTLCMNGNLFQLPEFTMEFMDFTFMHPSMDCSEVEKNANESMQKALYRYNLKLHHLMEAWLEHQEQSFCIKVEDILGNISGCVLDMVRKQDQNIQEIRNSEAFRRVRRLMEYE